MLNCLSTVSFSLIPEPTSEVSTSTPSPLAFPLKPRAASSSTSSGPALPSPPPQPASVLLQSRLPRGSRAHGEQGPLGDEQLRPGEEPQGQLHLTGTDRIQLARVGFTAGGRRSVYSRTAGHQTGSERTYFYPSIPHQDAKSQRSEGDSPVTSPDLSDLSPSLESGHRHHGTLVKVQRNIVIC